jgi:hypothetical protein
MPAARRGDGRSNVRLQLSDTVECAGGGRSVRPDRREHDKGSVEHDEHLWFITVWRDGNRRFHQCGSLGILECGWRSGRARFYLHA